MESEIISYIKNGLAVAVLNRPEALNALNYEMITVLSSLFQDWEADESIKAVVLRGAGERGFCAGGDIKKAREFGLMCKKNPDLNENIAKFYREEYSLNRRLFHYKKPSCAFMHGITMGGGYGLSGPCRYRIVSENTVFAMPEVGIGFFPDVGSTYYMNRFPGQVGAYLCVTGQAISVSDVLFAGIGTHYIRLENIESCLKALSEKMSGPDDVEAVLAAYSEEKPEETGVVEENFELINRCFSADSIEEILQDLKDSGSDWAKEQAAIIESRSPTSLAVALRHYRWAEDKSFDAVIARDYELSQHFMAAEDFYEGVRSAVVDKDKNPQWKPGSIQDLKHSDIERYMEKAVYSLDDAT